MESHELINEMCDSFEENDEWDACFKAVEAWDKEHDLIARSNLVNDDNVPKREHLEVLARCFGHKSFRPMQWKIINSILNDKRDNCAIMATGYGKSLCFQYPAVYIGGITIVVSPLISLMEDQILSLEMSNISACLLGSAQTEKKQTVQNIFSGKYSLIYLTPEFCCGDYGQSLLQRMNNELPIILLAIDEAHCVSSWGHDFRFQYRELGKLRDILPHIPILAVTATATPKVRSDIVSTLKLRNPQVLCSGFDRPNLQFTVYLKGNTSIFGDLKKVMVEKNGTYSFPGSTIIYCITRKQTEEIAQLLKSNGIKCLPYHAGMSVKARKDTHEKFVRDKVPIIVATIAFGMGIDKPDVRYVIHYGSSKDIESYYQEVGRAGRDGQPSFCITFYNSSDFDLHQTLRELHGTQNATNRSRLQAMEKIMIQYLETRDCRRQFILSHFEGSVTQKKPQRKCCDNCTRKLRQTVSDSNKYEGLNEQGFYDFSKDAQIFLEAVQVMNGKFGFGMYILFLRGSKSTKLYTKYKSHPLHGSGKSQTEDWWKNLCRLLEREGYLKKTINNRGNHARKVFSTFQISYKGENFLTNAKKNPNGSKLLLKPSAEMFKLLKCKIQPEQPEESHFINPIPTTSTSTFSKSPKKPSLKLLKVASQSTQKSDITGSPKECILENQESATVYRLLMNKRTEIASSHDCMPYMVASNEALMKMAEMKPLSIKEFRECQLEGFTEAKIKRFGEEFVKTLRIICNIQSSPVEQTKKTIQDILAENPLPGVKMGASAEATYSMYKSGLTVQEIATKRGVIPETIISHLSDAIKVGYPVKMIDLGITDEMREVVLKTIRNHPINSDTSKLSAIKEQCPSEITFSTIKIIISYLSVRKHLENLKVAYEEYEDFTYESDTGSQNKRKESESVVTSSSDENQRKKIRLGSLSLTTSVKEDSNSRYSKLGACERAELLELLDSPSSSNTNKKENTSDLDETYFEDDFLNDYELNNVDKIIVNESNRNQMKTEPMKLEIIENTPPINDIPTQPMISSLPSPSMLNSTPLQTSDSINRALLPTLNNSQERTAPVVGGESKNKLKKFQFKSKVPLSVENITKKLYMQH